MEIAIAQKIKVDDCIAKEIAYLNSLGVRTEHSCCGHGEEKPYAIIASCYSVPERAKELGYEPYPFDPNDNGKNILTKIDLRSKCTCAEKKAKEKAAPEIQIQEQSISNPYNLKWFFARIKNDIYNLFRKIAGKPPIEHVSLWPWQIHYCTHCGKPIH